MRLQSALAAWLLVWVGAAGAAGIDGAAGWQELSAARQSALAPLQGAWDQIDAPQRDKWVRIADQMPSMPAADRERLRSRMLDWARTPAARRGQARLQYQQAQRWSAEERRARWQAYQSLHPQARQVLAERWKLEADAQVSAPPVSTGPKRNVFAPPHGPAAPPRSASPTTVQAPTGATTRPLSQTRPDPMHPQVGVPKIAATGTFVDPQTLLPKRGPQGAAMVEPAPPEPAAARSK